MVSIILVALVLRCASLIVAFQHFERAFQPDSQSYISLALKLLSTGKYPTDSAWRTPVYPLFIAMVYGIGGNNPITLIFVQIIISTASVLFTYRLGIRLMPKPAAMIGALLMAFSVKSFTHAFFLLTETLFTFLLLAAILVWVKARQDGKRDWLVLSALLMGAAILTSPIALYFPLVMTGMILFDLSRRWIPRLQDLLIYLVVTTLILFPWVLRNNYVVGLLTVSTISNYNLLFYNAAAVQANLQGISETDVRPEL